MARSDSRGKAERLLMLQKMFAPPGAKWRTSEIADKLGIDTDTVRDYIEELSTSGRLPLVKDEHEKHYWVVAKYARFEPVQVSLSHAEATAFYIAGRLLVQINDERNQHVIMALMELVKKMPEPLRLHLTALVTMAEQRQSVQNDCSAVFAALAQGWANQRKVRLHYAPLHNNKRPFDCMFSPYLLEPSGIGRTIYAIGHSDPPGKLRTYKLERIEFAKVTGEAFTIPTDFNGPDLLARAWGIMYGDEEPVTVRLRFSPFATRRLKETLWHPSQVITDTPEGCEWTATIGDMLEIENWIRGWGADCEVLEPPELRERIMTHVRQLARMYGVLQLSAKPLDEPDDDLLDTLLGE